MPSLSSVFDDHARIAEIQVEAKIWNFLRANPGSDTSVVAQSVGMPDRECFAVLKGMMDKGIIAGELVKGKWY